MWVKGEIFRNLDEAEASARGSLDRNAQASLFDRIDWFRRTHMLVETGNPLIVRARAEGSDCWLFLSENNGKAQALASWYTLSFSPVFTGDPGEAVKQALLVATARRLRKHVSSVTLSPVPDPGAQMLCRAFDRARWIAHSRETSVNWTVPTEGMSFPDYWAGRSGELRSTVKRKAAKYDVRTQVLTSFDAEAWDRYEAIYDSSWKPDEGAPDFLRAMAEEEGRAGTLRLGFASIEAEPVAAQLWTVENGRAVIHKLAHLESAASQSPGSVLTAAMFEHVIDADHVALVDFGTGNDSYKADWMDTCVPLHTITLFNPSRPAGLAGAARASLAKLVDRLRKR